MNPSAAIESLLDAFPALRQPTEDYRTAWIRDGDDATDPGPYNLLGDVFFPRLLEPLIAGEPEDAPGLARLFGLIEKLATEGDRNVVTLVKVGICERLGDAPDWLRRAQRYMGARTLELSDDSEAAWGRAPRADSGRPERPANS